jgi:branched-chain amino acid transport system ATP-binding protein
MLLEVKDLEVSYGYISAVKSINLRVEEGEITALLGANGAGKTTTLKAILGLVPKLKGQVKFDGRDITSMPPHKIVKEGITCVPEGRCIFENLTVKENLELGGYLIKNNLKKALSYIFEMFPILEERKNQYGATLSGGEQQILAIARGLMTRPKLLLLDEPSLGLSPILVRKIFSIIKQIREEGITILLVEQNARLALTLANRAYIMETGRIIIEGESKKLLNDDRVKKAYLGG